MGKKIVFIISKGHGTGSDRGAVSGDFVEVELTTKVANACVDYLKKQKHRDYVVSYGEEKKGKTLPQHLREILDYRARFRTVFVDIHFNAGGGDGMEVFIQKEPKICNKLGHKLATYITSEFKNIGQNSRGIKTGDYFVTNIKEGVNIIVECGFLDNKVDRKLFDTDEELEKMGVAIAKACIKYNNAVR